MLPAQGSGTSCLFPCILHMIQFILETNGKTHLLGFDCGCQSQLMLGDVVHLGTGYK